MKRVLLVSIPAMGTSLFMLFIPLMGCSTTTVIDDTRDSTDGSGGDDTTDTNGIQNTVGGGACQSTKDDVCMWFWGEEYTVESIESMCTGEGSIYLENGCSLDGCVAMCRNDSAHLSYYYYNETDSEVESSCVQLEFVFFAECTI